MGKANPWVWKPFTDQARTDGLVFHHWERKTDNPESLEYQFAKFNVKVDVPTYTDDEYEAVLKSEDWTREETDYLFELCREYDLRFPIIGDRYDYPGNRPRSIEDLKARYYSVCRGVMEQRTPLSQMTTEQLTTYNLMKFDKDRETERKKKAAVLFSRTPEQIKEEEMLLAELKRIVSNQDKMLEERRDLFERLHTPQQHGSITAYNGSQGLAHLRELLLSNTNKDRKRKSIAMGQTNGDGGQQSPAIGGGNDRSNAGRASERDSMVPKKQMRKLSEEEEKYYGVAYHDKLTPGVKFRSSMVSAAVKGGTAQKISVALTQLGIANKLTMPTVRTVQRYEQLQSSVGVLLDTKKLLEKLEQEIRVLKAQQEARIEQ